MQTCDSDERLRKQGRQARGRTHAPRLVPDEARREDVRDERERARGDARGEPLVHDPRREHDRALRVQPALVRVAAQRRRRHSERCGIEFKLLVLEKEKENEEGQWRVLTKGRTDERAAGGRDRATFVPDDARAPAHDRVPKRDLRQPHTYAHKHSTVSQPRSITTARRSGKRRTLTVSAAVEAHACARE